MSTPVMMNTSSETRTYVHCPECNGKVGTIDHLGVGARPGPWWCDDCGAGYFMEIGAHGVSCRRVPDRRWVPVRVSMVLPPQTKPITFIVDTHAFDRDGEALGESCAYFYNEHTCPTNWLQQVEDVIFDGEGDPHGLFEWVSTERRESKR